MKNGLGWRELRDLKRRRERAERLTSWLLALLMLAGVGLLGGAELASMGF